MLRLADIDVALVNYGLHYHTNPPTLTLSLTLTLTLTLTRSSSASRGAHCSGSLRVIWV